MVLGDRAFERQLDHEVRTLMNEISALVKETPETSGPFFYVRTQNTSPDTKSAGTLIMVFLACRTVTNTFLLT